MLRLNRRLLGAAGALVAAATLTVTGLTAASAASTGVSGTEFTQIMTTSATSPTESIIVHGLFTDYGVDHSGNNVDTIVLQQGSYKVAHPVTSTSTQSNPATCFSQITEKGTFRVFDGTGKYAGISGHGTFRASVLFIAPRVSGKCSQTQPPVAFQLVITASGPASLP